MGISYHDGNVICLTKAKVPLYVKFVASLGQKFNFTRRPHDPVPLNEFSLTFEKLLQETNQYGQKVMLERDLKQLYDEIKNSARNLQVEDVTAAQHFIRQLYEKTKLFLRENDDVVVAPSDKGGKTVIMDRASYKEKVKDHIRTNLLNHTYFHWKNGSIERCRAILEPKYDEIRMKLNPFFAIDAANGCKDVCMPLKREPYMIARLYALVKVHKEGYPVRPIVSAPDCWAKNLSLWILKKLELISVLFNDFKVKNSEGFVKTISSEKLKSEDHRLAAWDYDAMFTNIPFQFVKQIIIYYYCEVSKETSVPVKLFVEAVSFLIEFSCYFVFDDEIYRQTKCLTMGNMLSQMLADIATNYATKRAVDKVGMENISFLGKYVDDFAGAMKESHISVFENELTKVIKGLKIKRNDESSPDNSVTFLDTMIIRKDCGSIVTRWWSKDCSARVILNYHSFHPMSMKRSVIEEYIRHAIRVTSPELMNITIKNLRLILRRSSYPVSISEPILKMQLSKLGGLFVTSTYGSPDDTVDVENEIGFEDRYANLKKKDGMKVDKNVLYIPMPLHDFGTIKKLKKITRSNFIRCRIAPRTTRSNRDRVFSKLKDKADFASIRFAIFELRCRRCSFKEVYRTESQDLMRTVKFCLNRPRSLLRSHVKENPNHVIMDHPMAIRVFRSSYDLGLAFSRVK